MATVPEFISVLRKIRDVIYPSINETYQESLVLKQSIDVNKAEFDTDFEKFSTEYDDFIIKKGQVDTSIASASNSALSASQSATIATNKSNEIKAITTQSTTGAAGTNSSVSYNPIDGKFTFVIPQGVKGDKGESFTVDSSGITANRTLYDNQLAKWSFLDLTTSILYFKLSNTSGDWSNGIPFGKGDKGDNGDAGVGVTSFAFLSTTDSSGLAGKSGATDTYKVTLTNSNTFNYIVYNGLDSPNIHSLVGKTTIDNEDEIAVASSADGFSLKKISLLSIKNFLSDVFAKKTELGGRKNYIVNGRFDNWAYKDFGLTHPQISSGLGSDVHWANSNVGSTKIHTQMIVTDTEKAISDSTFYSRTVVTSVAGANNYVSKVQPIENVAELAGKTVTISFKARADTAKNIAVDFAQMFGSGGTPSANIVGIGAQKIALTSIWQKKYITVTLPSIEGKTLGTAGINTTCTFISFWFDAGSAFNARTATLGQQYGTFDIMDVKIEDGNVPTDGWHPYDGIWGSELQASERYCEMGFTVNATSWTSLLNKQTYRTKKRVGATIVVNPLGGTGATWASGDTIFWQTTVHSTGDGAIYLATADFY